MNVQWYPGHMTKAKRSMMEERKLIDIVVELLDSRVPYSSRNPDIDKIAEGKARIVILNKADLGDERANEAWKKNFEADGAFFLALDSRSSGAKNKIEQLIDKAGAAKRERDAKRGIKNRPVRAMVVGIPNVGKSTLINTIAGKSSAKTGNKPGVTKGNQWIRLNKKIELLDTPGILWPKFEDPTTGLHLALLGSINDQILEKEELACSLIEILDRDYPEAIVSRYGEMEYTKPYECLEQIAIVKKCLKKGNEPDISRSAAMILDDFRTGKLGKISLERP